MRKRWKVWATGLALALLLAAGAGAALLWPTPNEAERMAALIRPGMKWGEVEAVLGPPPMKVVGADVVGGPANAFGWSQSDGSMLIFSFGPHGERFGQVMEIRTRPPAPVPPLTRLRRTLARAFPFLAD
jgi:hypothetical protein